MKKKKKCAFVFGITDNYTFALANTLIGLKKHSKVFWDDIIVYHENVSPENQDLANKIIACHFVKFENDAWCQQMLASMQENRYSIATFYRYECFNLLDTYEKVIWSDVDVLVQGDLSGLLAYGDKSGYACSISHEFTPVESNFSYPIDGYNMFIPIRNAGLLVLSDKLADYGTMTDWCLKKSLEYVNILRMPDQGILNLLLQDFKIDFEEIDIFKYHCFPDWDPDITSEALLLHAYSERKFWNNKILTERYPEWHENNIEYLHLLSDRLPENKPTISVIMSLYNRIEFLHESVDSIINQTFTDFEFIIVVEFCETQDEIVSFLNSYHDSRIKIIKNSHKLGFAASLNLGVQKAEGKFIARMDDDDISHTNRFATQIAFLNNNPQISICGTYVQAFGKENAVWNTYPTDPEQIKAYLLFYNVVWHPTVMMRIVDIRKYNLYYDEEVFCEDYELWARAIKDVKIANIPEVLLQYRITGNNITWKRIMRVHESHIDIMRRQFINYLKLNPSIDEMQLMNGRIDLLTFTYVHSKDVGYKIRENFKKEIIKANKNEHFYNSDILKNVLNSYASDNNLQANITPRSILKRFVYAILRPFMNKLNEKFEQLSKDIADNTYWNRVELQNKISTKIDELGK